MARNAATASGSLLLVRLATVLLAPLAPPLPVPSHARRHERASAFVADIRRRPLYHLGVPLHVVTVGRVTLREPSHILGCQLVRGIGWSWACRCGERGRIVGDR